MRIVKAFKVKNNIKLINRFLERVQLINEDNRVLSIETKGAYAVILASVEVDALSGADL